MDETPEELEQIRRDAEKIDIYKYRKRFRLMAGIGLGALLAGIVEVALLMNDGRKNPCDRVRNHFCKQDPNGLQCKTYTGILDESLHDDNSAMRANVKAQCLTKIERLKDEDGIEVK